MKIKILAVFFAVGIFIGIHYVHAQQTDVTIAEGESIEVGTFQEEELVSTPNTVSDIDEMQEDTVQSDNEVLNGVILDGVPHIQQLPELARGCEVTSLAMMLQYAGLSVDKMMLATEIETLPFRDENGLQSNPNEGFVGDIYSFENPGYAVYHMPIAALAETYLPGSIIDLTGGSIDSVYNMLENGSPVWVITNSTFTALPEGEFETWETQSGKVQITYSEHSVLLVGYDENYVYLNDPLADQPYTSVPRDNFEESWIQMGKQAVSYHLY